MAHLTEWLLPFGVRPVELLCQTVNGNGQWVKRLINVEGKSSLYGGESDTLAHVTPLEEKLGLEKERADLYDYLLVSC